jgi:ribonuclease E
VVDVHVAEEPEEIVEILDIPVKARRASRRVSTADTENLLEEVLGALPEPKSPGQGRGRGRSV